MSRDSSDPTPTIVGGQPIGKQGGSRGLPRGIEAILLLAAAESSFRSDFAEDRRSSLRRAGIRLTEAEEAILETVSDKELFAMATRAATSPAPGKRGVLATAVSLAALASLTTASRTTGADDPDSLRTKPALSQFDVDEPRSSSGGLTGESQSYAAGDDSPTPTPTEIASYGIRPEDTPTPTETPPLILGINPDSPTPTATQKWTPSQLGVTPDTPTPSYTPTPTETPPQIDGIRPDTPTPTTTPTATSTPDADLDGDGVVDHKDLMQFMQQWYKTRSEE